MQHVRSSARVAAILLLIVFIQIVLFVIIHDTGQPRDGPPRVSYHWVMKVNASTPLQYGHMGTLTHLKNGNILMAFQGSKTSYEGSPLQGIYWTVSRDLGKTWEPIREWMQSDGAALWAPVLYTEEERNTTYLFYARSSKLCEFQDVKKGATRQTPGGDIAYIRSTDSGATWSEEVILYAFSEETGVPKVVANPPITLANGELVLPFWREPRRQCATGLSRDSAGVLVAGDPTRRMWQSFGHIASEETWLIENTIAQTGERLLQLFRTRTGRIYRAYSDDDGRTWTKAGPMDLLNPNSKFHLLSIPSEEGGNNRLLLAYNPSSTYRNPLSIACSSDGGVSWSTVLVLENTPGVHFSYPTMLQLSPRILLIVYSVMKSSPRSGVQSMGMKTATLEGSSTLERLC